jgi:hypothetical protein
LGSAEFDAFLLGYPQPHAASTARHESNQPLVIHQFFDAAVIPTGISTHTLGIIAA